MFGGQAKGQDKGAENEQTKKKHFDKDFIILSEFSEQVGPVPLQYIPDEKSIGTFDTCHFSVRIMTSDYQAPSGKLVGEDTQVLLSEKQDHVYAYVHYFSLNDINARGYVRQYCFSYITSSSSKLVDNFDTLKRQFCEVTSMLKCSNHHVFRKDLEHHLADLNHTMAELTDEGWSEKEDLDNTQLYKEFDFTAQDVPERDPTQVENATRDTTEILETLKTEMDRDVNKQTWLEIKKLKDLRRKHHLFQVQREKERTPSYTNGSPAAKRVHGIKVGSPDSGGSETIPVNFTDSFSSELTSSTSSDTSHYQPQRVMTHTVHKFERRLRPLNELSPKAFPVAMDKLKDIYKFFSRSELTLEMEKEETPLLDPRSSLLSIGRVPMVNILQSFNHFLSIQPSPLLQPKPYQISCKNTWGQPSEFADGEVVVDGEATEGVSGFDLSFLEEKASLNRCPLYIDLSPHSFPYQGSFVTSEQDYDCDTSLNQSSASRQMATLVRTQGSPHGQYPDSKLEDEEEKRTIGLSVHQEEDRVSRGSHGSAAYVTPETGLTPASSNDGDEGKGASVWEEDGGDGSVVRVTGFEVKTDKESSPDQEMEHRHSGDHTNLDFGTRVPSQLSFTSVTDNITTTPSKLSRESSVLSLQGDILGGKTAPTVTTSIVVAQADLCSSDKSRLSRSFSPLASSSGINGDALHSTEVVSFCTESWEDWGTHEQLETNIARPTDGKSAPEVISNRRHLEQVGEEAHSAGSGQFDSNYLNQDTFKGVHSSSNSATNPMINHSPDGLAHTKGHTQLDRNTPSDISIHSMSSDELHTLPHKTNGYPGGMEGNGGGGINTNPGIPGQLSFNSKPQTSPERYYSPVGAPPEGVFGSAPTAYGSLLSPGRRSLASQMSVASTIEKTYRGPSLVELRGKGKIPLVSSIDLVECGFKFKPGRGIFAFCKDNMSIKDLFYCLLHGRPLAIIGRTTDENSIRRLVRMLWMFIPGHSSKQQVIQWQDKPMDVKDLSRVKLIGLSNIATNNLGPHLKRYVSYWDVSTGKVFTPTYNGELLKPIVSRTRDRKNEQAFLAHSLSVLLEIAMKAYVYYHSYCTSAKPPRQATAGEPAAKVFHSVHHRDSSRRSRAQFLQNNFGIRGSDVDIIEYLVDIIRDQQLTEWKDNSTPNGTPHNDEPVTFKLYTKHCRESTNKAKRPY